MVTAACFLGFTGFTLVMPFLPLFIAQLGVADVGAIAVWTGISLGVTPALTALLAPAWGRLGDRYAELLNDVRTIVRVAVLRASGREIDSRADEFFAVFERPSAAIEAAVEFQRALGTHRWPDDLEVTVRAGIHSGRPTLTDAGYIGLAVHTTARVCSAAHGGQIR